MRIHYYNHISNKGPLASSNLGTISSSKNKIEISLHDLSCEEPEKYAPNNEIEF